VRVVTLLAVALAALLALLLREQQRDALRQAQTLAEQAQPARLSPAAVALALRSLELVTVTIDTSITIERGDEDWRGGAKASLTAPLRLRYGVDLAQLDASRVLPTPLNAGVVLRVPRPRRISLEVFAERETFDVSTTGLRLRSRAGEYYLGLARRDVHEAARRLKLLPRDQQVVRDLTRAQVESLARSILGPGTFVKVIVEGEGVDDLSLDAPENAAARAAP
jgi:hypothetical protein